MLKQYSVIRKCNTFEFERKNIENTSWNFAQLDYSFCSSELLVLVRRPYICDIFFFLIFFWTTQANSISLRTKVERAEYEPYQVFFACAGATFDFGAGIALTPKHILTAASLVRG